MRAIFISLTVLALSSAMVNPAIANSLRERGKAVTVADSALTVTPGRDWNRLSARPGKKAETWTLDGDRLNDLTWYAGIADGEPLVRERSKKREPLPKFTSHTLLVEIPELVEGTYRADRGIASFTVNNSVPDRFLGQPGIRFTFAYIDGDDLPRKGEGRAAIIRGQLYVATFDAPRLYFFDRSIADFRAVTDQASLP